MTAERRRILVVEDDETLRETLAEVMLDEGHEVRTAAHGADALECLEDWSADLIVLDLMMPLMDAYEFRARQRHRPDAPTTRIVVLSAARNVAEAAERLGADAWLTKPFALDAVLDLLSRLLDDPPPSTRREPSWA